MTQCSVIDLPLYLYEVRQFDILLLFLGFACKRYQQYKSEDKIKCHIRKKKYIFFGVFNQNSMVLVHFFFLHSPLSWWLMTCLLRLTIAYHHRPLYCFFLARNRNWHQWLAPFCRHFLRFIPQFRYQIHVSRIPCKKDMCLVFSRR